jgi:hypothetical protein
MSSRQGCNPVGESPAAAVIHARRVVMPYPGVGSPLLGSKERRSDTAQGSTASHCPVSTSIRHFEHHWSVGTPSSHTSGRKIFLPTPRP